MGHPQNGEGGGRSYVILVVKRINAHGEDGEEQEEWREGMEAGDGAAMLHGGYCSSTPYSKGKKAQ